MNRNFKIGLAVFGLLALLMSPGCGNTQAYDAGCRSDSECGKDKCYQGVCVQCRSDGDCGSANNACMTCQSHQCVKRSANCCVADLNCKSGQRCWNKPGKRWGECGSAN